MKVSVCLALYNGEKYIEEQLLSIISEVRVYEYEILISDDGSSDNSLKIIKQLGVPNIFIFDGPRKGLIKNFESLLEKVSGDIIFLSDQDDVWLPGKLKTCIDMLEDYDLVVTDAKVVDKNLQVISNSFFNDRNSRGGVFRNLYKNSYLGCCMAFKKNVLHSVIPFPKAVPMHDWWIGLVADFMWKVGFINEPLIMYRRHESNVSDTTGKSKERIGTQIYWRVNLIKSLIYRALKLFFIQER